MVSHTNLRKLDRINVFFLNPNPDSTGSESATLLYEFVLTYIYHAALQLFNLKMSTTQKTKNLVCYFLLSVSTLCENQVLLYFHISWSAIL